MCAKPRWRIRNLRREGILRRIGALVLAPWGLGSCCVRPSHWPRTAPSMSSVALRASSGVVKNSMPVGRLEKKSPVHRPGDLSGLWRRVAGSHGDGVRCSGHGNFPSRACVPRTRPNHLARGSVRTHFRGETGVLVLNAIWSMNRFFGSWGCNVTTCRPSGRGQGSKIRVWLWVSIDPLRCNTGRGKYTVLQVH